MTTSRLLLIRTGLFGIQILLHVEGLQGTDYGVYGLYEDSEPVLDVESRSITMSSSLF